MLCFDAALHDITAICFDALGFEVVDSEIILSATTSLARLEFGTLFFSPGRISRSLFMGMSHWSNIISFRNSRIHSLLGTSCNFGSVAELVPPYLPSGFILKTPVFSEPQTRNRSKTTGIE
jgi:hypothetical protein